MAHIKTWDDGRAKPYQVRWSEYIDGKRRDGKASYERMTDAKARKRAEERRIANHESPPDPKARRESVKAVAERWYDQRKIDLANEDIRPSTLVSNRRILDVSVLPFLGDKPVAAVTVEDVKAFRTWVQVATPEDECGCPHGIHHRSLAVTSMKHHLNVLRQVMQFAVNDSKGALTANPVQAVKIKTKTPSSARFNGVALTDRQVGDLVDAMEQLAPGTPWPLLVRFMAYTGPRCGEVAGMNIGDLSLLFGEGGSPTKASVSIERIRVRVPQKGGGWRTDKPKCDKTRVTPILQGWLREDLAAYLAQHPHRDDRNAPLWPGTSSQFEHGKGGRITMVNSVPDYSKPWDRGAFYKRFFQPALKLAGLPPMRLHDLRHTAATIMISAGVDPYRVAAFLGHDVQVCIAIYTHVRESDIEADAALFAGSQRPGGSASNVTTLHKPA